MTAEEFLDKQIRYEFTRGDKHPPEKMVTYDAALAALQLKEYEAPIRSGKAGFVRYAEKSIPPVLRNALIVQEKNNANKELIRIKSCI